MFGQGNPKVELKYLCPPRAVMLVLVAANDDTPKTERQ
jgi:hypothetical protein